MKELIKQRTRVGRRVFQAEGTAYAKALGQDAPSMKHSSKLTCRKWPEVRWRSRQGGGHSEPWKL